MTSAVRVWSQEPNSVDYSECVYESYRDNRDDGIPRHRLIDVFGDISELEERYREECYLRQKRKMEPEEMMPGTVYVQEDE